MCTLVHICTQNGTYIQMESGSQLLDVVDPRGGGMYRTCMMYITSRATYLTKALDISEHPTPTGIWSSKVGLFGVYYLGRRNAESGEDTGKVTTAAGNVAECRHDYTV